MAAPHFGHTLPSEAAEMRARCYCIYIGLWALPGSIFDHCRIRHAFHLIHQGCSCVFVKFIESDFLLSENFPI